MLELNINNGKLIVEDSGELSYTDAKGAITDLEKIFNVEEENK